jgi:hypothetical protein
MGSFGQAASGYPFSWALGKFGGKESDFAWEAVFTMIVVAAMTMSGTFIVLTANHMRIRAELEEKEAKKEE